MHKRLQGMGQEKYKQDFNKGVVTHPESLNYPMTVKKPTTFFVDSMSDLFHEDVPFEFIYSCFTRMSVSYRHTFQILTKRIDRAAKFYEWLDERIVEMEYQAELIFPDGIQIKNIWIGTSCEDQATADERIPYLLQIPAAVRFLSCEPLLGPIDICQSIRIYQFKTFGSFHTTYFGDKLHWVIAGGESGHGARPMHPDWVRSLRDQCKAANVPFFFKQWGEYRPFEETGQAPFYRDCATNEEYDGHILNCIDYDHPSEAGLFKGFSWFPPFDAITLCLSTESNQCSWLKMGKVKSGNHLDGVQHLNFPETRIQKPESSIQP